MSKEKREAETSEYGSQVEHEEDPGLVPSEKEGEGAWGNVQEDLE